MQTYSHLIVAAVVAQQVWRQNALSGGQAEPSARVPSFHGRAFLLGSVAPDIPLILLTAVYLARDLLEGSAGGNDDRLSYLFRYQFFHDPWVITAHNLFHAPLLILLYGVAGYWAWRRKGRWGLALFWFAAACMMHTLIDIPLHYDDGPLLLYPIDWTMRFMSPFSYWDPAHFGIEAALIEHVVVLGMLIYVAVIWRRRRRTAAESSGN